MTTSRTNRLRASGSERGYTLIEVLVAMALASILVTLGAFALRSYWINRSLEGARAEVGSTLRQLQQQTVSESHPLVFGARFTPGSSKWATLRYDPRDGTCTKIESDNKFLNTAVYVTEASFATAPDVNQSLCPASGEGTDVFVWFYARGTATPGSLTLAQPQLDRELKVTVSGLTSRIEAK
jgi:prepilin-type N-terminal cleavage/methylation domain-containing protein